MNTTTNVSIERFSVRNVPVLFLPDRSLPLIHTLVATRHGSARDPVGIAGLTRVLFELMLRGTKKKPRNQFSEEFEELGSEIQSFVTADIAFLRTLALKRNFHKTWNLAIEAMVEPALAPDEFSILIDELVEDLINERDDDDSVADRFLRQAVFPGHPLGRSPAGEISDLLRMQAGALQNAHRNWFCATDFVLVFAGDLTIDDAKQAAEALLNRLPQGEVDNPKFTAENFPKNTSLRIVDKPDRTQVQLRIAAPAPRFGDDSIFPYWLGIMAFGGTFTSPLTQEIRDKRGWSYFANAYFRRQQRFRMPVVLRTAPALADAIDCLELQLKLLDNLAQGKIGEKDVELARSYLLNRYPFEIATASDLIIPVAMNEILGEPADALWRVPELIESASYKDVQNALHRYLTNSARVITLVATAKDVHKTLQKRFPKNQIQVTDFRDGLPPERFTNTEQT